MPITSGTFSIGHVQSQKVRSKISDALKGRKFSEQHRRNISENHRGYQSPETRAKISAALKGKKKSLAMRKKLSLAKQGPQSLHLWKGGITPINRLIRESMEYRLWRTSVYERDDYTCQFCGVRGGKLNADHIKPFADYIDLRFELTNGRTLCEECHRTTPTFAKRFDIKTKKKTGK